MSKENKTPNKSYLPQTKEEKEILVSEIFQNIAQHYDLMNDLITFGLHKKWKQKAIELLNIQPGEEILDLACGTGDLSFLIQEKHKNCSITGIDISPEMLSVAKKKNKQKENNQIHFAEGNALKLNYPNEYFDKTIISYGLRNVTDYKQCLEEIYRITKPEGKLIILDMSRPSPWMNILSWPHRQILVPLIGRLIVNNQKAYKYLTNSIDIFLNQKELITMLESTGWQESKYIDLMGGVSAIHSANKL